MASIPLDHHIYDEPTNRWLRRPSKSQPFVRLCAKIQKVDYENFGFHLSVLSNAISVEAMADTGCQSCLAGFKFIEKLKLSSKDLIPVNMQMHSADNHDISILGAVILRLSGRDQLGDERITRQIIYITDSTDKLFFSREACMDLGIISAHFPVVGGVPAQADRSVFSDANCARDISDVTPLDCNCLKRTKPPPLPTTLPCPAPEENVVKLKQYLLECYSSSTFNTCEHQPLPMMEGSPMRLMIDPKAKPTAYHSPIPVPIHWQDDVKAGLDRDVRLGVLELVPVGEPVTWCHRMVICAKKNGKPRRTIDFQSLNTHATRETHHTQSPFHQARSVPHGKKKTVFDAWNGYHSVSLHPDDRHYTTFITPWGRYRYCTASQGYIASGVYCFRGWLLKVL